MGLFSRNTRQEESVEISKQSPYDEYVNTCKNGYDGHSFEIYDEEKPRQINIIVNTPNNNKDILIGFKGKLLALSQVRWTYKYKDGDKEKQEKKNEEIAVYYVISENVYETIEYFLIHRQLGNGITKCNIYQQWEYRELLDDMSINLSSLDLLKFRDHILNYISKGEIQLDDPIEAQNLFNDIEDGLFDYDDYVELTQQQNSKVSWGVEQVEKYNKIG